MTRRDEQDDIFDIVAGFSERAIERQIVATNYIFFHGENDVVCELPLRNGRVARGSAALIHDGRLQYNVARRLAYRAAFAKIGRLTVLRGGHAG